MQPFRSLVLLAALLAGAVAAAVEPAPNEAGRFPDFSWDTIPLYMHIRKTTAFNAAEVDYLSSFPLVTLEKYTGHDTSGTVDRGTIAAAEAIKKKNPRTKVLFYRNVFVHYGGYSFDKELLRIDQPFLVNKQGATDLVRGKIKAYDLANPEVINWWVNSALTVCRHEAIDGLFIDGNLKVLTPYLSQQLPAGKKKALTAGYSTLVKQLRTELPSSDLLIANMIRARHFPDAGLNYLEAFDGSYLEGFEPDPGDTNGATLIAKGIHATQQAARSGKIIAMTLGLGESAADSPALDDTRAKVIDLAALEPRVNYLIGLFLVCAERYSYLSIHDGYSANRIRGTCQSKIWLKRFPQYDRPLGQPLGPAEQKGFVYTRQFEHLDVTVDVERRQATLAWRQPAESKRTAR